MNGYVRNKSGSWIHALKRSIAPNEKIQLSVLYDIYGKKHGLPANEEFVSWLRTVKLKDALRWDIVYHADDSYVEEEVKEAVVVERDLPKTVDLSIEDVVMLSFRKAKEVLPKVRDQKLLKYALAEANKLSGKDSLCRLIRTRIKELELMR